MDYCPRFIVLEGIDGSGKSTLAARLAQWLRGQGQDVLLDREPSDSPAGREIRRRAAGNQPVSPQEELELFLDDRRHHVAHAIGPALSSGKWVVLDRYFFSTAAYQGARGLDPQAILEMNRHFAPEPKHVFLLDLPVHQAWTRLQLGRETLAPLFEHQPFLERVREQYLALARPPQWVILDAMLSPEEVLKALLRNLDIS